MVLGALRDGWQLSPNHWRPGGTSYYTPLHQAAWHGAPVEVVEELLALGSWRTLRTARGQRAVDIAADGGHERLVDLLAVKSTGAADHAAIDEHLAALVESRIRPQIDLELRHPTTEVLTEVPGRKMWYPVPGMYGGFNIELRDKYLYVTSWSRVVGGSGKAHVVTREGTMLVDRGFV
ncbi:hypothetical protein ABIE44_002750 [Marmoricola sp. OAE513]|uniref:ankyrin repeat domain-containing protein n=1 Tax=Marmoricola sp. OAE513 TaxID=2817894 RepID=UPI001AE21624